MATFAKATFNATGYAAFRPTYPSKLYDTVLSYHRGPTNLLLDLGCGPGTATKEMSKRFKQVVGTDPSPGMIKQAQEAFKDTPNASFQVGSAESTPFLEPGTVDCIIAAQASHWFNYSTLWPELARLLRPGGTVAFWGYKDHVFVDFPRASEVMQHYAYDSDKLGRYWPQPGRSYVQDKLRVLKPPEEQFEDVRRVEYEPGTKGRKSGDGDVLMEKRVSVGGCKEYVRTWSSYHGWKEANPEQVARSKGGGGDIMDQMFDEIAEKDEYFRQEENEIDIEWGSAIVMARRN